MMVLELATLLAGRTGAGPLANALFAPGPSAVPGAHLRGVLRIRSGAMRLEPEPAHPVIGGRDARIFPGVDLDCCTHGSDLIPADRGRMLPERAPGATRSYWQLIVEPGRVWRAPGDAHWSRAALPITLVSDLENQAHQGLALFAYGPDGISPLTVQFIQQSGPYLIPGHFVAWGTMMAEWIPDARAPEEAARRSPGDEPRQALPTRPWCELPAHLRHPEHELASTWLPERWRIARAAMHAGTLFHESAPTPWGPHPYPLGMHFAVRSVTKSILAPLALLHLATRHGQGVLEERIGALVHGLHPKWQRVRLIDVANMASGFGGVGSLRTAPNDLYDGYLEGPYDEWYCAPACADKLRELARWGPYPFEPGTVVRYRDQDYFLLGVAIQKLIERWYGAGADLGDLLDSAVLRPIGVQALPAVRTREPDGGRGVLCCNAGCYPTLEDLARIALLYEAGGRHGARTLLEARLVEALLEARLGLDKTGSGPDTGSGAPAGHRLETGRYALGWHFVPRSAGVRGSYIPCMRGSGGNSVVLDPQLGIRIALGKAPPPGSSSDDLRQRS